jgi:hypothetical protein
MKILYLLPLFFWFQPLKVMAQQPHSEQFTITTNDATNAPGLSVKVDRFLTAVVNRYILDSSADNSLFSPAQLTGSTQAVFVGGRHVLLTLQTATGPTSVKGVPDLVIGHLSTSATSLAGARVRITRNNRVVQDWQDLDLMTLTDLADPYVQEVERSGLLEANAYVLLDDDLAVGDRVLVEVADGKHGRVFLSRSIERLPLKPFLAETLSDTLANGFWQTLAGLKARQESIDAQYHNRAEGLALTGRAYPPDARLLFLFRRPGMNFHDSTLEYRLLPADTGWHTTGHILPLFNLRPDQQYTLEVRYAVQPESKQQYTFYTQPHWYQTTWAGLLCGIAFGLVVLLLLVYFYRRRLRRTRQRQSLLTLELQAIRSQLNPHFLFNALSNIQLFIHRQEVSRASEYLQQFSSLLRDTLQYTDKEQIPVAIELNVLENYIRLEQLRIPFRYHISIKDLDIHTTDMPALLLQPLVENAVKHAVSLKQGEGQLDVSFTGTGRDLVVTIADNGNGYDTAAQHTGHGLRLVRERIRLLNLTQLHSSVDLQVQSNDGGTRITIRFHNWLP